MSAPPLPSICAGPFFLDAFCLRQWEDAGYSGTRLSGGRAAQELLVSRCAEATAAGAPLVDGYAPFCKHLFLPNFCGATVGALRVTGANRALLRSGYSARTPAELPVLQRWFSLADVGPLPVAKHLDVILYSREQARSRRSRTFDDVVVTLVSLSLAPQLYNSTTHSLRSPSALAAVSPAVEGARGHRARGRGAAA